MRFRVTPASPEHARPIAEVHVASWRSTYKGIVSEATLASLDVDARAQVWSNIIVDLESTTRIFIALEETDQVIGFAASGPVRSEDLQSDSELYAIYLNPRIQRNGVGSALVLETARYLKSSGFSSMGVWVLELNPSRGFYEAIGGEVVAKKSIDIGDRSLTEIGYRWESIGSILGG